jgi:two-component system, LytTR family, sensor kinase
MSITREATRRLGTYWSVQLIGWTTYALIAAVTLMPMFPVSVIPRLLLVKGVRGALGVPFSDLLRRLYAVLRQQSVPSWAWVPIVGGAHIVLGVLWYLVFVLATSGGQGQPIRWVELPHRAIDSVVVLAAWSALYFGITHWREAHAARGRAEDASHEVERAQLAALRYQLSPHFLFNALNSIRSSIIEDPTRARAALTRLADLLRLTVYAAPSEWMTLDAELEWARNYLALEQLRFEDRLETSFVVGHGAGECLVPSFLMHPVVENAVKHGWRTSPDLLRVHVSAVRRPQMLEIHVANTGRLAEASAEDFLSKGDGEGQDVKQVSCGIGIANIRQRLALLDPVHNQITLVQDGEWVRLSAQVAQPAPVSSP